MNPPVTYEAAIVRMNDLHREAERIRVARVAKGAAPSPLARPRSILLRRRPLVASR